jgi:hypothetical protein
MEDFDLPVANSKEYIKERCVRRATLMSGGQHKSPQFRFGRSNHASWVMMVGKATDPGGE